MRIASAIGVAAAATVWLGAAPAAAAIRCIGEYQVVQGQQISTPYCQDNYLAQIAREYGLRVSAASVRNSPSVKSQVCRLVSRDNRAQNACASTNDEYRRRPF